MASAEEPAQEHINLAELNKRSVAVSTDSAARPSPKLDGPSMPRSLQKCGEWLKYSPRQTSAQSKPIQRLHSAVALLQSRSSRQKREEVQQLLGSWDVSQKAKGCERKYDEVKADSIAEVDEEARRLKRMRDAYEPPSLDGHYTGNNIFPGIELF